MPHEGPHSSWLKITADMVAYALGTEGDVLVRFDLPQEEQVLVLQLNAVDARRVAEALLAKAREAAG